MKKKFAVAGMVVCAVTLFLGILVAVGSIAGDPLLNDGIYKSGTGSDFPSNSYDYGYAQFGSDYYSYTNNNMAMAAKNASIAASNTARMIRNQNVIRNTIRYASGFLIISIGAIGLCGFGIVLGGCKDEYKSVYATDVSSDNEDGEPENN